MKPSRARRHPVFWPTIAAAAGIGVLLALGSWQLHRLHWKNQLIAARAAALAAPPLALDRLPADARPASFRRVRARGRFDHDREMHLAARVHRGRAGVEVVTPFRLGDGSYVLVNRGWAPSDRADSARPAGRLDGEVEVAGILRRPGRANTWIPDNRPDRGVWHYVDPEAMARSAGLAALRPFVVEAGPAPDPGGYPIGGRTRTELPNDHLQYALTWYALAAGLAAVYALFLRKRRQGGG